MLLTAAVILLLAGATTRGEPASSGEGFTSPASEPAADAQLSLEARLSDRFLFVLLGDSVAHVYPIAIGKAGHPTPTGTFSIRRMIWNPRWVPPDSPWARGKRATPPGARNNPMQGVKIFFREPTYYIHGTNDEASIGHAASHGCIRMTAEDAAHVARWLMEHGGQPRPEGWYQRVRRAVTREHVVQLSDPIQLVITQ
jgi:lipoprotein-anchoring transpeptidase ErfK/SrfK